MKNTKIIQAWDTVTPTAAQKRRMRDSLEAKLTAVKTSPKSEDLGLLDFTLPQSTPEETGKHTQKTRPKCQAVQPKKNRGSAFAAVAALLAVVIAGGLFLGVMTGNMGGNPSFVAPKETEAPKTREDTKPTELPAAYQEIIQTYVTAIEGGWNPEQCNHANISILTANVQSTEDLGYAMMDLDEDGEEELLITDGNVIYSLYSLTPSGETVCFITGMERDAYYLSDNGIIANVGSGGAAISYYIFYSFSNDTLDVIQQLTYDAYTDPENPWFRGEMEENITEEQANAIIDAYPHRYISHTTLSGRQPLQELEVPDEETLKGFAQQLPPLVNGDNFAQYQLYCFYDYDGDGETELLLGTGNAVYMVLEPDPSQADNTPFFVSPSGAAYPCENHVMESVSYGQGYTRFYYLQYGGENDGMALDYVYTDGQTWYRMDENEEEISLSEEEAQAIRGKYKHLNLPWKNISEFPVTIPVSTGERISALFDDLFLPIAEEGKHLTEDELRIRLEEKGFLGTENEGLITVVDTEVPEAYLRYPVADASGYVNGPLTYAYPDTVGRYVAVQWEGDTARYWMETGTNRIPYSVSSAQELTDFLTMDDNTLLAMKTAESFARAYFAGGRSGMLKQTASDVTIGENKMFSLDGLDLTLQQISGLYDVEERYNREGFILVSAAVYLDDMDSYDYLSMELVKENEQWKVHNWWLEK